MGAQTPSLVPAEISAPMSPGHSAQGPQRACLSYQPHSHHLLHQRLACLVCLHRLPPATDTMGFGAVRRDLGHGKPPGGQRGARVLPSLCWGWHQAPLASQHCMDPPPTPVPPQAWGAWRRAWELLRVMQSCFQESRAALRCFEPLRRRQRALQSRLEEPERCLRVAEACPQLLSTHHPLPQVSVRPHCHSQSCWVLEGFPSLQEALELVREQLEKQRTRSRVHATPAQRGLPPQTR